MPKKGERTKGRRKPGRPPLGAIESLPNRIREHRLRVGMSTITLAELVGTSNQQIGMLERGERKLTQEWMKRLATPLKVQPHEFLIEDTPFRRVKIAGIVQAGYWAEPGEEMEQPPADEYVGAPLPEAYQPLRLFAVRVAGNSMNLVFPPGTVLICALLDELYERPEQGKFYVVRRTRADGRVETTVKQLSLDERGQPWLWPRSNDPEHQQPIPVGVGLPGETIDAYARVVYSMRPH